MKKWYKQKTTWTGIAGVISAAGGFFQGIMSPPEAIQLAVISLLAMFFRQGMEK